MKKLKKVIRVMFAILQALSAVGVVKSAADGNPSLVFAMCVTYLVCDAQRRVFRLEELADEPREYADGGGGPR